jgi:peptidoglycan/LPS O-acetylase OafA/YrhL
VLRFGLAIAVATPLFAFVERPFLRLKGRWSVVTPPPRAAAPAVALADGEATAAV